MKPCLRLVGYLEGEQCLTQLFDGFECPHPEQVLLKRTAEALGASISFRRKKQVNSANLDLVGIRLDYRHIAGRWYDAVDVQPCPGK
jgi:hypothetical protein